ncbi:Hydrogenase assembly chaperone hypC/hupF (plasmid) [Cupriavidus taiwanensis]|uniref:Hydrogenase assembly chaperone hypC/hupF n=1 Tax=Cupriavidus taiwanensis TaxID=164546 RepID=A0A375HFI1_9BURK|nr:HypC/HybG/HupF family hydrogenase formation chaperone [Cupriavidus taiwanensis]SOZ71266.1 Hydrogenase assembly chaperone hypC/hupF [Cupriavidus taiwanensis]SOZ72321.1 Hydrogenase assembly chaperone hypC/hupF [Cupriavidus taiwanensis]SOZ74612.1 Hydrogenase assembly chaperone hypC/hupF [Cupriavidus taiwanensis]SPA03529.1 Hydrogenase assembly chaperone hypC/hupF [Cupriavidus taiwanensis]SPA11427.1 Hydrogenase assembly chaperone hypC/hupF [Cupriavidus taiwanensis]
MCLAIPARLIEWSDTETGVVDLGGVRKSASLALVPDARPGDYVIVHVGFALGVIDPEEAERTLALFGEVAQSLGEAHDASVAQPGAAQ